MSLVAVVATLRAQEGRSEDLGNAIQSIVAPSRADEGCLMYEAHRSTADPRDWMVYERWSSQSDLDAHLATGHLTAFAASLPELIEGELNIATFTPVAAAD